MDVDAVISRAPEVVIVDELAHTNVPGSRHAKRWQDVELLLDEGISDVALADRLITAQGGSVTHQPEGTTISLERAGVGSGAVP